MSDNRQFVTLDSVINQYIDETMQGVHSYFRIWNIAMRGLEQLGIDTFYTVKSVKLPVADNKTVVLPPDFLQYTKIGVLNNVGQVISLKYNSNITTYADQIKDRIAQVEDNKNYTEFNLNTPYFYNYYGYGMVGNIYGVGSDLPTFGEFKIDNDAGLIVLGVNYKYDYIILEYLCSPKENGDYKIPAIFREALIAWISWKEIANLPSTRRGNINDKQARRHEFYNERRLAIARYSPFRIADALDISREAQRLAIKN